MISTKLSPLFDVKLIATGKQHFYQLGNDETYRPGVTTALSMINKPALVQWASNTACQNIKDYLMANALDRTLTKEEIEAACLEGKNIYKKKAQEAAEIGSKVHSAINSIILGIKPEITPEIESGVASFEEWKESNHLEILAGDTKLGSRIFGYGGSLDFVAMDGNEAVIFDVKTTRRRKDRDHGIYPEYGVQLAAYSVAFRETFGIPVKAVYALWVDKEKPGFKALKVSNINVCFESFLACLQLYRSSKIETFDEEPII